MKTIHDGFPLGMPMFTRVRAIVAAGFVAVISGLPLVLSPTHAVAQTTVVSVTGPDNSQASATFGNLAAQIVTVPAGVTTLNGFTLRAAGGGTPTLVRPAVYEWNGNDVGAQIFGAGEPTYEIPAFAYETLAFSVGVPVIPGQQIVIAAPVENAGQAYNLVLVSDAYSGGSRIAKSGAAAPFVQPAHDFVFSAEFQNSSVAAIPTMSEWALILLGIMLAGGAVVHLQRRRSVT